MLFIDLDTGEDIPLDDALMLTLLTETACEGFGEAGTRQDGQIARLLGFGARESDGAGEVDLTGLEEAADHKKVAGLERPDGLFLVDRRRVVDQRTDQTCGVWPADFDALDTRHTRQFARSDTEVDLTRGKLGESGESQLQLVLATLSQIAEAGSKGSGEVRCDEDVTGLSQRISQAVVGTLLEEAEHTTLQEESKYLRALHLFDPSRGEGLVLRRRIGAYFDAQDLALGTAIDSDDFATDRRGQAQLRRTLVAQQSIACQHLVAWVNDHFRDEADVIIGDDGIALRALGCCELRLSGLSLQIQREALLYRDNVRHNT